MQLIDSTKRLPDTSTFSERPYKAKYTPDYVARPSIGYTRSNFGNGVFGGTSVELSDMLGDHQMLFSGYVNGRIDEAQVLAAYVNLTHRTNWAVGISQDPYFFNNGAGYEPGPSDQELTYVQEVRRIVLRSGFVTGYYPLSRFQRIEAGLHLTNVEDATLDYLQPFDPTTGLTTEDPTTRQDDQQRDRICAAEYCPGCTTTRSWDIPDPFSVTARASNSHRQSVAGPTCRPPRTSGATITSSGR